MCPELDWTGADWTSDDFGTGGELCVPIAGDLDAEWAQLFERHASDGVKVLSGIRFGRIGVTTGATTNKVVVKGVVGTNPESLRPILNKAAKQATETQARLADQRALQQEQAERHGEQRRKMDEDITRRIREASDE
jgi:hypothetical protein